MADIISGSSRFNGDKNAPARKVIQMNNVSEAATHETEDDEIVKHRIKKHRSNNSCYWRDCNRNCGSACYEAY